MIILSLRKHQVVGIAGISPFQSGAASGKAVGPIVSVNQSIVPLMNHGQSKVVFNSVTLDQDLVAPLSHFTRSGPKHKTTWS